MNEPYVQRFRARWADIDFNQHMRNAAYLGYAEETRMLFMDESGWAMKDFTARKIGPVILEDKLTYKKELALLEPFRVDLAVAGSTADGRRMRFRNRFFRESDGGLAALVESVVLWFDLVARRPVPPPPELFAVWQKLARTEDFEPFPEKA